MRAAFDVIVLGSGFAGSLLGAILASRGRSVAIVDRGTHPRFTIGESSTPTADFLLRKLTAQYELKELQPLVSFGAWRDAYSDVLCGCKRGFSYLWHGDERGFRATSNHACELLVAASDSRIEADTQWYRPDVDTLFAEVARDRGVQYFEQATVQQIKREAPLGWRVDFTRGDDHECIRAEFIVDASGPSQLLLKTLGVDDITACLRTNTAAVYGHFASVPRVETWLRDVGAAVEEYPYPIDDSAVHHLFRDGWMWQLRFDSGLTSLGYVFNRGNVVTRQDPASRWRSTLDERGVLKRVLRGATLAAFPGQVFSSSRLQRLSSSAAGKDWAALPFTVGFIDPLHSTGIAHSLRGVDKLCEALLDDSPCSRNEKLQDYSTNVVNELRHIDRIVAGCYTGLQDFRLFGAWAMIYFAAATTSERRWLSHLAHSDGNANSPGFLCADDQAFVSVVAGLTQRLDTAENKGQLTEPDAVRGLCEEVRESLEPFNHVGLFRPRLPNLYHRSAVPRAEHSIPIDQETVRSVPAPRMK